jgi:hypothetical protein
MVIDQRNAGAAVTPSTDATYVLDRWQTTFIAASKFSVQQSTTAPANFLNSMLLTSTSAYTLTGSDRFAIQQHIEGLNVSDLGWGTASAQTVTLSFWVRSSLTGLIGGAINNGGNTRSYPFSFTVSSSNTWEYKTVTIPGDTTGTWAKNNTSGIVVKFCLGAVSSYRGTSGSWAAANYWGPTGGIDFVATNGATLYLTGVQLEVGTQATPYEWQGAQQQLAACQRYYEKGGFFNVGYTVGSNLGSTVKFAVRKRAAPTLVQTNTSASNLSATPLNASTGDDLESFLSYRTSTTTAAAQYSETWTASAEL